VNCTNGTINWKQIYGEESFRLKSPVYESDYVKMRKVKEVDLEDLGKRAQQYAKVGAALALSKLPEWACRVSLARTPWGEGVLRMCRRCCRGR